MKKIKPVKNLEIIAWAVVGDGFIVGGYHHHGYEIYQTRKEAFKYWNEVYEKGNPVRICKVRINPIT